ncbi:helix-turn-helix domain-containing protein [Paenibacillus kobensis]|uniref:helix-turn-helix domain-containing protein n=1 Tax=Paenibacillus kobensis TaxID=59841 RepID=UPI000FDC6B9B|nr:AraC family transcriptional regulator [Paenibacillus kobensis]
MKAATRDFSGYYPDFVMPIEVEELPAAQEADESACYRIKLIGRGTGIIRIGERRYPLITPSLWCLNEQETFHIDCEDSVSILSVRFHPSAVNERFNYCIHEPVPDNYSVTDSQDIWCLNPFFDRLTDGYYGEIRLDPAFVPHAASLMREIGDQLERQPDAGWPCRSRSSLLELLYFIRRIHGKQVTEAIIIPSHREQADSLEPVIRYLHANYRERLTLDELARQFNTNRTTLNRKFNEQFGCSVIAYLNKFRIQMACSMLHNTLLPIHDVMDRIGANDTSNFIRSFRKHTGLTPAEYRNIHCWMLRSNS